MFYFNSLGIRRNTRVSKGTESNQTEPSTSKLEEFLCYSDAVQPCQFLLHSNQRPRSSLLCEKHLCKHSWWYTHFSMSQHVKPALELVKSWSHKEKSEVLAQPKRRVKPETAHQPCTVPTQKGERTVPPPRADSFTLGATIKTTNWMTLRGSPSREAS